MNIAFVVLKNVHMNWVSIFSTLSDSEKYEVKYNCFTMGEIQIKQDLGMNRDAGFLDFSNCVLPCSVDYCKYDSGINIYRIMMIQRKMCLNIIISPR